MMSKTTALRLALVSATLSVLFAFWRLDICAIAAFLLMLVFDGIWAHKVDRDHRLSKLHSPVEPEPPILKTSSNNTRLSVPSAD